MSDERTKKIKFKLESAKILYKDQFDRKATELFDDMGYLLSRIEELEKDYSKLHDEYIIYRKYNR